MAEEIFLERLKEEQVFIKRYHSLCDLLLKKMNDPEILEESAQKVFQKELAEFLECIIKTIPFFENHLKQHNIWDKNKMLTSSAMEKILKGLGEEFEIMLEGYQKPLKTCCCCGQKVYYDPLGEYFYQMRKQYQVPDWVRGETGNEKEYSCPVCGSFDRDRIALLYLKKALDAEQRFKLLHVAPSKAIEEYLLSHYKNMDYQSCDQMMPGVTFQANIENMPQVKTEQYDYIICIDVLEHVNRDAEALNEFYRVLKKGGQALIISPVCRAIEHTDEDIFASEEERWKRFGQNDHVRLYSKTDFLRLLETPGFHVRMLSQEYFGEQAFYENALLETSTLYLLEK